ncbi:MAG: hypothetical protein AVDCRST_MAG93-7639, partial [uncultured Chloroflexia bacterium]
CWADVSHQPTQQCRPASAFRPSCSLSSPSSPSISFSSDSAPLADHAKPLALIAQPPRSVCPVLAFSAL